MRTPDDFAKFEINERLAALGKDRAWLAGALVVSLSTLNQWLAPKGYLPEDRLVAMRLQLASAENPVRIGDPEGNLLAFTIEEFEQIEATRQRLHYETRPALYRDAVLAFIEAESEGVEPVRPANVVPLDKAAETPARPPVTEERREVVYEKPRKKKPE